ncbi:Alkylated DNA repair protein AlkB [Echinococcus granulosus]|uniref:Alkylated DNA repair protein AlkB n=1 Tax=Echinococcus granulosus TaxID=6210 RepID=W6V0G1_ECHGR|nr:Alkylated DNA repair protein AlkB [Echinococcus granulosus]EUB64367.1 Alkylated DNA repair protein AlkB [Echinococcus granulosus]
MPVQIFLQISRSAFGELVKVECQDFGLKVNFKKQRIAFKYFTGLPDNIRPLVQHVHQRRRTSGVKSKDLHPVELCNLEYLPERRAAIVPHVDDTWLRGERLISLNLASAANMTFTSPAFGP